MLDSINDYFNILFQILLCGRLSFIVLGDSRMFNAKESYAAFSSMASSFQRKPEFLHGDKVHRSKASAAIRRRVLQTEKEEKGDAEIHSIQNISRVNYDWKNSRKKLLLQYFHYIWRKLCETESIRFSKEMEDGIRKDVRFVFNSNVMMVARKQTAQGRN